MTTPDSTTPRQPKRTHFAAALATAIIALAGSSGAFARQEPPANAPAADAPLGGPAVEDRAPPGDRPFGESMEGKGGKFARRGPQHGLFLRAAADLEGPLALTEAQEKQLREIESDFRNQMKAYRDQHADEIKKLREQAGLGGDRAMERHAEEGRPHEGRPPERRPGKGRFNPENATPEAKEARTKLKAIMEGAPKPDDSQARQWAVLNDEQRGFVKARMQDMQERVREGGKPGEMRRGPDGPDGPRGPGGPAGRRGPGGPDERRAMRGPGPEGDAMRGPREHRRGPDGPGRPDRPGRRPPPGGPPEQGDAPMDAPPPPPPPAEEEA